MDTYDYTLFFNSVSLAKQNIQLYTQKNILNYIFPKISDSLLFFDIQNTQVNIVNKCNHIIIRNCKNCFFDTKCVISGIDIILSTNIDLNSEKINFLEIHSSSDINVTTLDIPKTRINFSMDFTYNNTKIITSPFECYSN